MTAISMRDVHKAYGSVRVIERVDLDIKPNQFCVFVGPSGCGKSTLLRMVAGLEDITSGEMTIDGQRVNETPPADRGVAMVFQSYALYPHMSIRDNMAFGLKLRKTEKTTIEQRVSEAAKILQIEHLLQRKPKELSGGQRQRVAIGRAIVRQPKVFLFDEPLSNLDAGLRVSTRIEIAKLHKSVDASMIYVTHDQVEAMTLADQIVLLNAGEATIRDGSVAQAGAPLELYHHPCNMFVAGFLGSPKMNFVAGKFIRAEDNRALVQLANDQEVWAAVASDGLQAGDAVHIGVRPEHIALGDTEQALTGMITHLELLGDSSLLYCNLPGSSGDFFIAKSAGDATSAVGEEIRLGCKANHIHVFRSDGTACRRTVS